MRRARPLAAGVKTTSELAGSMLRTEKLAGVAGSAG
jgi:hypothetical protein